VTRRIVLRLSVSAQEEADELQAMLQDETDRAVLDVPGLRAVPPPVVRVDAEAPDRLCATVACTLEGLIHADGAQRELAKRLRARLRTARVDASRGALSWGLAWRQPISEIRTDSDVSAG
jgi:hypothetical protein